MKSRSRSDLELSDEIAYKRVKKDKILFSASVIWSKPGEIIVHHECESLHSQWSEYEQ